MKNNELIQLGEIANVYRIKVFDKEKAVVISYFRQVLEDVTRLVKLRSNVNSLKPLCQTANRFRQDVIGKSLSQKEALSGLNNVYQGFIKVEAVLETE